MPLNFNRGGREEKGGPLVSPSSSSGTSFSPSPPRPVHNFFYSLSSSSSSSLPLALTLGRNRHRTRRGESAAKGLSRIEEEWLWILAALMPPPRVRTKWKGLVVTWHCCQDFLPAPPPILCKKIPHYQFVRFFLPPSFLLHQRRLGQRYVGSAASEPMEEICKALFSPLPRLPFTALYSGSSSFFFSVLLGKHDLKSNHRFLVSFLLFPHPPPSSLFFLEAEWATEEKEEEEEGKEKKGEGGRAAPEEWGEGRSVRGLSVVRRERRGRKGRERTLESFPFPFSPFDTIQSSALFPPSLLSGSRGLLSGIPPPFLSGERDRSRAPPLLTAAAAAALPSNKPISLAVAPPPPPPPLRPHHPRTHPLFPCLFSPQLLFLFFKSEEASRSTLQYSTTAAAGRG